MWKCPNCDALNDANFCAGCGTPRPVDEMSGEEVYEVQETIQEDALCEEVYDEAYDAQEDYYAEAEVAEDVLPAPQGKGNTGLIIACIAVICVGLLAIIISLVLFFSGSFGEKTQGMPIETAAASSVASGTPESVVSSAPKRLFDDQKAFIEAVKKGLRVPNDADVECQVGTPYIWEAAGGVELVPVTFTKNGELVAGADCNVISGEICRSIYMYTPLETEKETEYFSYKNGRFGFSIDVPTFLTEKQEGQNGSGATFKSADGTVELYAYGEHTAYLSANPTIDELYAFIKDGVQMELDYDRKKDNWFVLSGEWGDKVIYDMHILKSDGTHNYFSIIYPESREDEFDAIVTHIYKSFKTGVGADSSVSK